jgi:PTH1 family peptidyl-tRNA hydrolase
MKLIIGLGNPGAKYKKTRHNVGFLAVDYIQKNIDGFSRWQMKKKLKAEISENEDSNIILAKPQTYMNSSGEAVKKLLTDYGLPTTLFTVIHDDFDLPLGAFKLEMGRGSAGHKGVQSIIDVFGTKDFWRLRIGVRPSDITLDAKADEFVLKNFTEEEKIILEETIPRAVGELTLLNDHEEAIS